MKMKKKFNGLMQVKKLGKNRVKFIQNWRITESYPYDMKIFPITQPLITFWIISEFKMVTKMQFQEAFFILLCASLQLDLEIKLPRLKLERL